MTAENRIDPEKVEKHIAGPSRKLFLTKQIKTIMKSTPERVWSYAADPSNWTSSSPRNNFGLTIESEDGQPRSGARFTQRERIGLVYTEVDGVFLSAVRPEVLVWKGKVTYYLLAGLWKVRLDEGGMFLLEKVGNIVEFSHTVYADFPETFRGRLSYIFFKYILRLEDAIYGHNTTEMNNIKRSVEPPSKR